MIKNGTLCSIIWDRNFRVIVTGAAKTGSFAVHYHARAEDDLEDEYLFQENELRPIKYKNNSLSRLLIKKELLNEKT